MSLHQSAPPLPLFDIDSALEIPKDVADGFLILLTGGLNSARDIKKNKTHGSGNGNGSGSGNGSTAPQSPPDQSSINLAFAALTDGNVIDATFGVESTGGVKRSKNTSTHAFNAARAAKMAILDAAISTDSIKKLAVESYAKCFEVVISYHLDLETIGFITWCIKHQKVRDTANRDLMEAFIPLHEVIASSI